MDEDSWTRKVIWMRHKGVTEATWSHEDRITSMTLGEDPGAPPKAHSDEELQIKQKQDAVLQAFTERRNRLRRNGASGGLIFRPDVDADEEDR